MGSEPAVLPPQSESKAPDLSIVLPAYNEGALIASRLTRLLNHFGKRSDRWELVVVDDGSTDGTGDLALAFARSDPRLRVVRIPRNSGKGSALARGFAEARGSILAATDADLSYALDDLDAAIAAVACGADVVTGNRTHPDSRINLPFRLFPYLVRRWAAGRAFTLLVRALFRLEVGDTQCGLKAFSRRAVETFLPRLRTRRFLADIEILLVARDAGLRVKEVPVHLDYLSRDSSVRVLSSFPRTLWDLGRIKAAEIRGRYGRPAST